MPESNANAGAIFDAVVSLLEFASKQTAFNWDDHAVTAVKALRDTILGLFGSDAQAAAGNTLPVELRDKISELAANANHAEN